jgi:DNA-binding transcriptional regulator YdaS (Cro superfamily)
MTKQALLDACEAVGGQTALARLLKLGSQGTVSSWLARGSLPAERVLAVEAATGVSRHRLRPDLYPLDETATPSTDTKRKRA